jgi:hypothetical protein
MTANNDMFSGDAVPDEDTFEPLRHYNDTLGPLEPFRNPIMPAKNLIGVLEERPETPG